MASEIMYDSFTQETGSPPKRYERRKKSWQEIVESVKETRKSITKILPSTPSHFTFRQVSDDLGESNLRLYFLGAQLMSRDNTILYIDLPGSKNSTTSSTNEENVLETQDVLQPEPLFSSESVFPSSRAMSLEEQLLRERKRLWKYGVTSYDISETDGLFIIPAGNSLYTSTDDNTEKSRIPTEIPTGTTGARLDPKLCPVNTDLLAFVHEHDIWVVSLSSGFELRLTHTNNNFSSPASNSVNAGVPSFVIQEEFDRFTGYWWRPTVDRKEGKRVYQILYEEVDESKVQLLSLYTPSGFSQTIEFFRYPRAGSANAVSRLKLLQITLSFSGPTTAVTDLAYEQCTLNDDIFTLCPWAEYLLNAGWTADGKYVFAVLLDRQQQHLEIVLIPPECFIQDSRLTETPTTAYSIYTENSHVWINAHNCIHFFPQTSQDQISFLFASEISNFCHLYHVTSRLTPISSPTHLGQGDIGGEGKSPVIKQTAVTSGDWVVEAKELKGGTKMWVDESQELVYFVAFKDTPLETHLYVTSYASPAEPILLTKLGFSHSVSLSSDFSHFVSVYSSLSSLPQCELFSINHGENGQDHTSSFVARLTLKNEIGQSYQPPQLFQYPSRAGHTSYGLYILPRGYSPGQRYPTVLFVYGGPQVQMVNNAFKGHKFLRLHTLAQEGYVVVVIDGRGSTNRGLKFEAHIKHKLGTVELNDQVEGLLWLASQTDFIDMSRVVIHGWSYGGYIAVMGLAQRPDIFKLAVAGAPVVEWELYDTGYTERYMDIPSVNPEAYSAGNVLNYVHSLPEDDTRLLLIHGLVDENVHFHHTTALISKLVSLGKPHQLQVYPNERHGIRNHEAGEHYKATVIKFLQDHL